MMLPHLVPDYLYGLLYQLTRLLFPYLDRRSDLFLLRAPREGRVLEVLQLDVVALGRGQRFLYR